MVITNAGDGSNGIQILKTQAAVNRAHSLADEGYEQYASGDGLQITELKFPDEFALDAWVIENFYGFCKISKIVICSETYTLDELVRKVVN